MTLQKLSGIIIALRPHKEVDRIVTLFSESHGLVRVIAKGVRRIRSHRSFHLDVLNFVNMETEESNGVLYLREISTPDSFRNIKASPLTFASACLIASFVLKILPEGASQRELFAVTLKTFQALNENKDSKPIMLSYFLKAMRILGYFPDKLPKSEMRSLLNSTLNQLDPKFTLYARRTLGTFSSSDKT